MLNTKKEKKSFKLPSAFTILFFIIVFIVVISWILKWSNATTQVKEPSKWNPNTGDVVDWTITVKNINAIGLADVFYSIVKGFMNKSEIIVFILCIGGFVLLTINTKSLEAFIQTLTKKMGKRSIYSIPVLMTFFSFCGATFGMAEETLGFYMITIPFVLAAGYDKLVGIMIVLFGAGVGCLASTVNPFVVNVAVEAIPPGLLNEITASNGMVFRWIAWIILTALMIGMVMWYASRVHKNPEKSVVFSTYEEDKIYFLGEKTEEVKFTKKRIFTTIVFLSTFVFLVFYMVAWSDFHINIFKDSGEWIHENIPYLSSQIPPFGEGGIAEVSVFFLISGLIIAIINWESEEKYISQVIDGAKDILVVCIVIAVAAGVGFVLEKSYIQQFIVNKLSSSVGKIGQTGFILVSYLLFIPISFLIPSTSGFAAAIFPIWGGTASSISQSAMSGSVAAFSYGNGVVNLITPTSGVVMGGLGIARYNWAQFVKNTFPFYGIIAVACFVILGIGSFLPASIF